MRGAAASRRLLVMALACAIAAGAAFAACSAARRVEAPPPPVDPTRLSHAQHAQIPCEGCHRADARPGADDHKPCDDGACHRKDFLGPPGKLCEVCHKAVTTQPALAAPLKPFPSDDAWQALPPRFSHRRHLDARLMEQRVGFHVTCADCHTRGDGVRTRPDHAVCARCHAAEVGLPGAPKMESCAGCHLPQPRVRTRARVIRDDLRFDHDRHRTDRKNQPIRCDACHERSAQSASYEDHAPPRVQSCVGCHDDSDRTPLAMRMRICETCHRERASTLTALAPRSHLPATERPIDHTIAFRRDHAEAAASNTARCATCHTQISGSSKQSCDDCHQTMAPSDHRITWRELDHGPESAASRDRCATCHVVEFCSACHSQRPRSHGYVGTFEREHGRLARLNVRACLTCHNANAPPDGALACTDARCHGPGGMGARP
jgi:hypothetical protein